MILVSPKGELIDVTKGAYKNFYKSLGYMIKEDTELSENDEVDGSTEDELSEDEIFVKEILEKPISQWNKDEVKRYVAIKNIDTSKASTVNEVKEIIKATF